MRCHCGISYRVMGHMVLGGNSVMGEISLWHRLRDDGSYSAGK